MPQFILDCDPGHDDAVALLVAARFLPLLGITTVFGNSTVDNTTRNALALAAIAGLDIPIAKGAGQPLVGNSESGESVHGKSGLDGANLPDGSGQPLKESAVEFIINTAREESELIVIAIAPLTNLATAIEEAPDITERIREISIMGGSTTFGNATAAAEFNIYADPEAAAIVFASGIPIRMAGLNVTTTFGITVDQVAMLRDSSSFLAREIGGALDFYLTRQSTIYRRTYAPIHDVCAVMPYTHPDSMRYQEMHVQVECHGDITRGQTICDQRGIVSGEGLDPPKAENAKVAVSADGDAIVNLVLESLVAYP